MIVSLLTILTILFTGCTQPASADEFLDQGIYYNDHSQYPQALESINKSLEINPHSARTWLVKSITLFNMRRFDAALESVDTALAIDPGYGDAMFIKGEILNATGKTGGANSRYLPSEMVTNAGSSSAHGSVSNLYIIPAGTFSLSSETTGPAVPQSSNITPVAAYCIIMEYNAARAAGANLIPLTDKDFLDFPEFTQWMNGSTGSGSWYNDARSAGDFIDCQGRFHAFLNLSCRNLSAGECASASKKSPDLFVHDGRYYSVSCLPGFGMSGHPGHR